MRARRMIITAVVLSAIIFLSGCLGGGDDQELSSKYELMPGMTVTEEGYSGDPDSGNEPSSQTLDVELMETMMVEVIFTLTWTDDAPDSEPDEFQLDVTGTVAGEERSFSTGGSSGELSITVAADDFALDSFRGDAEILLDKSWQVTVSAISCGSTPLLPVGPGIVLNDPDEGNEWQLSVDNTHVMKMRDPGGAGVAPEFTVTDTDGNDVSLSQFAGEVVVLDMMMRCGACEDQIEELKKVREKFGDRVNIISVDIDPGDSMEDVREMKEEHDADWIFAIDSDSIKSKYEVTGMRKLAIIDINGDITFKSDSVVNDGRLSSEIDAALSGKAGAVALGPSSLLAIAFITGITAFFAPCAFPMLPGYITYYLSAHGQGEGQNTHPAQQDKRKLIKKGLLTGIITGMGIAVVYLFFGLLLSMFGVAVSSAMSVIAPIIAVVVIIIGLTFILGIPINLELYFYRIRKALGIERSYNRWKENRGIDAQSDPREDSQKQYTGLFYYGFGYAAASTGCHGVAFISIVLVGLASGGFAGAMGATLLWVIGMALIMVIVTILLAMAKVEMIQKITKNIDKINRVTGVLLVLAGILIILYLS